MPQDQIEYSEYVRNERQSKLIKYRNQVREHLQATLDAMQREYFLLNIGDIDGHTSEDTTDDLLRISHMLKRYKDAEQSTT